MTVGQRIAQKRKELGLSQEALGERLGVSRQAIYKWESDAALPEIEKLITLSRVFSVSVGWLLGEEDEAPERPELTAEQLRMVEEIVSRYLAAQPAQDPVQTRKESSEGAWPWFLGIILRIAALGAALVVILLLFWRLGDLEDRFRSLQGSISYVREDVNQQINGIAYRVESILESQNRLTAEQSAEVAATDYRANTVSVAARALPRTYVEGMAAEFLLVSGGETVAVPGTLGSDHAFTAELTGPLSDSISVSVVFVTGDKRETQLLDNFSYLYSESFPDVRVWGDLWGSSAKIREYADVHISRADMDRISSLRFGLFRDGKLLAWYEHLDEQPKNYLGNYTDTEFFRLEGEWTMEPGHEYCHAAVIVDEYGRERVYSGSPPVIYDPEEGFADFVETNYELSYDPVDWDY